jgi:hypothetical protein
VRPVGSIPQSAAVEPAITWSCWNFERASRELKFLSGSALLH